MSKEVLTRNSEWMNHIVNHLNRMVDKFERAVMNYRPMLDGERFTGRWLLKKALYTDKDQSYVLYVLTQDQLAHTKFPLGGMDKPSIRKIAEEQGFCNARKHDSQDICFVPDGDYVGFMERYTGKYYPDGDFLDVNGNVVGRHHGAVRYTCGQRKGLGSVRKGRMRWFL